MVVVVIEVIVVVVVIKVMMVIEVTPQVTRKIVHAMNVMNE